MALYALNTNLSDLIYWNEKLIKFLFIVCEYLPYQLFYIVVFIIWNVILKKKS